MVVTYVSRQNEKQILSSEVTSYILPSSGSIVIKEVNEPLVYMNGDSFEVRNGGITIPIGTKSIELEVEGKTFDIHVLCRDSKDETKFDYNALGIAFHNNLVNGKMDEDILFGAIEEDLDELKLPLCTFNRKFESITKDYDVEAMAECVSKLPHIFNKPKQHLKQVNEVRPAAVVSRIGQESISHLASHSEHWKGIKASGLVPERLLARSLEDDYAIYENLAVKTMVDKLYRDMKELSEENIDCGMQMDVDDGHAVSGEQKTYFHARDVLLKGMDDDTLAYNQLILEDQRSYIKLILEKLGKCRSTPLYRTLKKSKPVYGKLKKTNIFMMDKYYKYAYELWGLMENRQEVSPYDAVQDISGEYDLFCKILFVFALKYFHFELDDDMADVFAEQNFEDIQYSFDKWHLSIKNKIQDKLDVNGFSFTMYMDNPIEVQPGIIEISETIVERYPGVSMMNNNLLFERPLDDKEQEEFIKAVKISWPNNKQKSWSAELKQKMYAAFANAHLETRRVQFIPWKYVLPDNLEDVNQTLNQIKSKIDTSGYDMTYILTATRPNEFANIEDAKTLRSLLHYGKANEKLGLSQSNIGVIPIGLNDINSYRRYTKILLDMMISLDHAREVCPICGDQLNIGRGEQSNIASCHSCGFQIINTKCSECGNEFAFTRYVLPKSTTENDSENPGFKVIAKEHQFGFKNITDAFIEEGQIHPICPCCGK